MLRLMEDNKEMRKINPVPQGKDEREDEKEEENRLE